ncbi:hypothetical protein PsorP6_013922 [Peronosclerospora sorghi]|uniref:Uncharacterized protein n=1 Tax=Peronosclerospora sorghi TaxID=230839 RepID=A0ACC0VJ60_9STRA|nr:hypothetical protein PsorP6_013922 [Peronosclerospora sorghi]
MNTQGEASGDCGSSTATNMSLSYGTKESCDPSSATSLEVTMNQPTHTSTRATCSLEEEKEKGWDHLGHEQQQKRKTSKVKTLQIEQRRERQWRRSVQNELRDRLVTAMMEQLQRITGDPNSRHLRVCASRYESFVWKKSANRVQYKERLEHRIESLRCQPSFTENEGVDVRVGLVEGHQLNVIRSSNPSLQPETSSVAPGSIPPLGPYSYQQVETRCPIMESPQEHSRSLNTRRCRRPTGRKHARKQKLCPSLASAPITSSLARRDELYFAKLREMKTQYRDKVALVFRELCRVNTVIQHSPSLRRHESSNLGDFLANLKKIIYLLEQQPGEACGLIPARKRAVEYLDVVESHIQRKVLPILHRLRDTYATILRPIVLTYMKNNFRLNRRY